MRVLMKQCALCGWHVIVRAVGAGIIEVQPAYGPQCKKEGCQIADAVRIAEQIISEYSGTPSVVVPTTNKPAQADG